MRLLSPTELLSVWEDGSTQHPIDRALTILAAACPESSRRELALLSVGRRDALLFAARSLASGPRLAGLHECPSCGGQLTFEFDGRDAFGGAGPDSDRVFELREGDFAVEFRLPDSFDLASALRQANAEEARAELLRRCVLRARDDGRDADGRDDDGRDAAVVDLHADGVELPPQLAEAIERAMAERDPQADVRLDLTCDACAHTSQTGLDIAAFFWAEIAAAAKRLMRDVHTLARAYGWDEQTVLALGPARRQFYIEMVS